MRSPRAPLLGGFSFLAVLLALIALVVAGPAVASEHGLSASLARAMAGAGSWSGAYVVNADSGRTVFHWSHTRPRILASNTKLFTTSAALARFGAEGTLATEVRGDGELGLKGVWRGNLYLVGGGDPTFGSASFSSSAYGETGSTVQ